MRRAERIGIGVGVALVALVVLAVGAVGVRWWLTRPARTIGVTETVDRFREQSSATPTSPPPALHAPVPGVYVYDTAGEESIDALGGDTHPYPEETAMTVTSEGCGFRVTWTPIEGRSESSLLCARAGGLAIQESTTAHEFLRQSDEEQFLCEPGAWWLPPADITTWTTVCRTTDRISTRSARVIALETMTVGGQRRDAVHIRYDDVLSADSTGTTTSDLWIDRGSGLVLQQHNEAATRNQSVIGTVEFREHLDLILRSVTPQT